MNNSEKKSVTVFCLKKSSNEGENMKALIPSRDCDRHCL